MKRFCDDCPNAPCKQVRYSPSVSPTPSPLLGRYTSLPNCADSDSNASSDYQIIDTGIIIPTLQPILADRLNTVLFRTQTQFLFVATNRDKIVSDNLHTTLQNSWSINQTNHILGKGTHNEITSDGKTLMSYCITVRIDGASDLLLSIISEYFLSFGFRESHVRENYIDAKTIIHSEWRK